MNYISRPFVSLLFSVNNFVSTLVLSLVEALQVVYKSTPTRRFYMENFLEDLRKISWTCLPIATLTVSVSSVVYAIHVAPEFSSRGLNIYLGGIVALALIREGVPVMGSLAVVTQFCTGMTAQIGSMKVTEQLDAMKIAKVYPTAYILVPMLFAGLIGFPIVTMICMLVGIIVNYAFSNFLTDISCHLYSTSILHAVAMKDVFLALVKSSIFGLVVTLVSFTCGILTVGGSKAVGNSTRISVVINFGLIVILDYIITALWI